MFLLMVYCIMVDCPYSLEYNSWSPNKSIARQIIVGLFLGVMVDCWYDSAEILSYDINHKLFCKDS